MRLITRFWRKLKQTFEKPRTHFLTNSSLLLAAIAENLYVQVFCKPVVWALIVLIVSFLPFILYPIVRDKVRAIKPLLFFIFGIASVICIYCMFFLEELNILGIPLLIVGVGIVVYVPHIFLAQMLYWTFAKPENKSLRKYYLMPFVLAIAVFIFVGMQYKWVSTQIVEADKMQRFDLVKENFITEKILGMHFKYHTRFSEYDGWRPPLHDPFLVAALWFNGFNDPLTLGLDQRIELYHQVYPENAVQQNCSCADFYSSEYYNDPIFKPYK